MNGGQKPQRTKQEAYVKGTEHKPGVATAEKLLCDKTHKKEYLSFYY